MNTYTDSIGRKIITHFIHPPIPIRKMDWLAYYDEDGAEAGKYGRGATEKEAMQDLEETHGMCFICGEWHEGYIPRSCETGDGV